MDWWEGVIYLVLIVVLVAVVVGMVVALVLPRDIVSKEARCEPIMGLWRIRFSSSIGVHDDYYVRMTPEEEKQYCDYAIKEQ